MDAWEAPAAWPLIALELVTLTGLIRRKRAQRLRLLPPYLGVTAVMSAVPRVWSAVARNWDYWALTELALRLLTVAVVVEIAARVFAQLPRARRRMWAALVLVVLGTLLAVWRAPGVAGGPGAGTWRFVLVVEVLPRLAFGAALLCVATLALMAWHRVPLDALHRAVLVGLMLFLILYAGPMASADTHTLGRFVMYHVTPLAYLGVVAMWAYMAWRREAPDEEHPPAAPEVVERVQPWRRRG
jgi:hypothetical protein